MGDASVVKVQLPPAASALPAASLAAVVMVAVYFVLTVSGEAGVNVAVLLTTLTVPATAALPTVVLSEKLDVVREAFCIRSENVTAGVAEIDTSLEESPGVIAITVGAVISPPIDPSGLVLFSNARQPASAGIAATRIPRRTRRIRGRTVSVDGCVESIIAQRVCQSSTIGSGGFLEPE